MKEVKLDKTDYINIKYVANDTPVFAKRNGKLAGMVIYDSEGWILKLGGVTASSGRHDTRRECIISDMRFGYTFFIED